MGDNMDHYLVNPNPLRHYGNKVQDNPMSADPILIITEYNKFYMEIATVPILILGPNGMRA